LELKDEYFGRSVLKEASAYALLIQAFILIGRNVLDGERRANPPMDEGLTGT